MRGMTAMAGFFFDSMARAAVAARSLSLSLGL
jgi:hypothetical protein